MDGFVADVLACYAPRSGATPKTSRVPTSRAI